MKKVISILCVVTIIFSFSGCSLGNKPDKIVTTFSEAMKAYDNDAMNACLQTVDEDDEDESLDSMFSDDTEGMTDVIKFFQDNASKIKYTIDSTEIKDDTATVTVKYTYNDASSIGESLATDYIQQVFALAFSDVSEDEMKTKSAELFVKLFNEKTEDAKLSTCDATVKFDCVKTDDGWKIKSKPDEISNILSCNIAKAFENLGDDSDDSDAQEDANYIDIALNDTAELSKFKVTATKVEEKTKLVDTNELYDDKTAEDGTKYVAYYLTFENITKNAETVNLYGLELTDSEGRNFECDYEANYYFESINYESVNPSMKKSGVVVFNVPTDASNYYITLGKDGTNDAYRFYAK